MKSKSFRAITITIASVFLCNLPSLKWLFTWFDQDNYRYSNNDGSFTFQEYQMQGDDFNLCIYRFDDLKSHKEISDTTLYRLNRNNPFKFWRYGDYIFKKKYRLPYQSWDKIKVRRGPIDHLDAQDF